MRYRIVLANLYRFLARITYRLSMRMAERYATEREAYPESCGAVIVGVLGTCNQATGHYQECDGCGKLIVRCDSHGGLGEVITIMYNHFQICNGATS